MQQSDTRPMQLASDRDDPDAASSLSAPLYGRNDPNLQRSTSRENPQWAKTKLISRAIIVTTYVCLAVVSGILIWQLSARGAERHVSAICAAGVAVLVALPMSLLDMNAHLQNLVSPLQRHYIRILALVPIYALESWLALVFKEQRIYLETLREAYEAFVVYSFGRLLLEFLGERDALVATLAARPGRPRAHMLFPLQWMQGWRTDASGEFVARASLGVFQYVVVRTSCACVSLVAEWGGVLCEGTWAPGCVFPWVCVAVNVSQAWAMYCLILIYHELVEELQPLRPFGKLVVIKAVVFFSFWQSIVIGALVEYGVIQETLTYSVEDVAAGLQDFLITVEMAIASIAHHYTFSRKDFRGEAAEKMLLFSDGRRVGALDAVRIVLPGDVLSEAHATGKEVLGSAHAAGKGALLSAHAAGKGALLSVHGAVTTTAASAATAVTSVTSSIRVSAAAVLLPRKRRPLAADAEAPAEDALADLGAEGGEAGAGAATDPDKGEGDGKQ